jgi:hypothetical protein
MDLRDVMLILHIVGAGTWLGANVVQMVAPSLASAQGPSVAAGWMRMGAGFGKRIYTPVGILVLVTGIVLVLNSDGAYSFGSLFVTIGFAVVIIAIILGVAVFTPGAEKAAEAIESGDRGRIAAATGRLARYGVLDTLLVLFAITVMVLRWD